VSWAQKAVKRAMDIIVSSVALIVLLPLLLLIALTVRLTSPGPALFRQTRVGKDGRPFTCYKFRTMYVNAPDIRNPDGSSFKTDDCLQDL
jgi:undecaprenyl phosphate N,N'-diacetylbacillosamine 1-phosphate transferase